MSLQCVAWILLAWQVVSASSSDLNYETQLVQLRHVPAEDVVEVRLVYRGVRASNGDNAVSGAEALRSLIGGTAIALNGVLVDLSSVRYRDDEEMRSWLADTFAWMMSARLTDSGLCLDSRGVLCAWQAYQLQGADEGISAIEDEVTALWGAARNRADSGERAAVHLSFLKGGTLRIALTVTPQMSAALLKALMRVSADVGSDALESLEALELEPNSAALLFRPGRAGWISASLTNGSYVSDTNLKRDVANQQDDRLQVEAPPVWVKRWLDKE